MQVLADVEGIKRLKSRYFRHLDRHEWSALRALFTDDATFDLEVPGGWVRFEEPATWLANLEALFTGGRTVHHGHTPDIEVDGDVASATWAMFDEVHPGPAADRAPFRGYGHYEETYRRVDGAWRISSLRLSRLWVGDVVPDH